MSWTITISGPRDDLARVELALEDAGVPILPEDHHEHSWGAKVPVEDGEMVLTVDHPSVADVARLAESVGWRLRTHHPALGAPQPDPLAATLADMRREIAELKARVA